MGSHSIDDELNTTLLLKIELASSGCQRSQTSADAEITEQKQDAEAQS
ncbi:hypothetical protein SynMITS9220_00644 [Synechococcus sp. MIT S9220]|nr:hypothetical protein SynMITS9220_00644 [Synechococcus sp. MIT S9220]